MGIYNKVINTKIGKLTLIASDKGLTRLHFKEIKVAKTPQNKILKIASKQLKEYFSKKRKAFSVPLDLEGTPFQKKSWVALTKIKYGNTVSYKQQAKMIKHEKAVRAVGNANGKNPIPIIVPCHRVIASNNKLGGFSAGLKRKVFLLNHESEGRTSWV